MILALFDLDHTLLDGDSDCLWTEFLAEQGIVDDDHLRRSEDFYTQYLAGQMDAQAFLQFQLQPLTWFSPTELAEMRRSFVDSKIRPRIPESALQLVDWHRHRSHRLAIVTATNRFVTEPIAPLFGIPELIATEVEVEHGSYTGRSYGLPCYQSGKVTRVVEWLREVGEEPTETWFYSDSINDVPLLSWVDQPVAVNPDPQLKQYALDRQWKILTRAGAEVPAAHSNK